MPEIENHFTVFIRLPFNRGDFVDPPPVLWSAAKERALWDVISRQAKGNEIDWTGLADQLDVTQPFLLQQAAWLYERQLSQVRAQMRKAHRPSATPSPAPSSIAGSIVGGQPMKRVGSGGSRVPSRLSMRAKDSPAAASESGPGTPAKSRILLPLRAPSALLSSQLRGSPTTSGPVSRQTSKESYTPTYGQSRRGSIQQQISKSPAQRQQPQMNSSDEDEHRAAASRAISRRPNPAATPRRGIGSRRDQDPRRQPVASNEEDEDEEDSPAFLPFAATVAEVSRQPVHQQDPSATLRGGFTAPTSRPPTHRRSTSERISTGTTRPQPQQPPQQMTSSASSASSGPTSSAANPRQPPHQPQSHQRPPNHAQTLSPRQRAALATLSPRNRPSSNREGSDTSPSMGSSFSDLDDASVTQSALEEALLSNMQRGNSNGSSTTGGGGGMTSRVSGISQALRSRYFDATSG